MAIKIDKKLNNEINNTIRNYNRKIARLKDKGYDRIPEKVYKKDILKYNRREIRQEINKLKRFTKRGSEQIITTKSGTKLLKWELEQIRIEKQKAFRKINKALKIYETKKPKVLGKVQDVTFAQMGSSEYTNLLAKKKAITGKNIKNLTTDEIKRYVRLIDKINKSDENLGIKENMIEIIRKNGYMAGIMPEVINKIVDNLERVDRRVFKDMIEEERSIKVMFDYYKMLSSPFFKKNQVIDDIDDLYDNLANNIEEIVEDYV